MDTSNVSSQPSVSFKFTSENTKKIDEAIAKYPSGKKKSAIMDILYIAQEQNGWISNEVMQEIALLLEITPSQVKEVATFYTMYYKAPVGKFVLQVCTTTPCMLRGAYKLMDALKMELKIENGETTLDGLFTLLEVECLGACANAPMMQINNNYYEDLTIESALDIIKDIKAGNLPAPGSFIGRKSAETMQFLKNN